MGTEHRAPTDATAKLLYGTAFMCAFPNCSQPLFRLESDGSTRYLNSRICHIAARREGGPRWDPLMDEDRNRSDENLILMCLPHASEIDDPSWPEKFPRELLEEWKRQQLELTERICRSWPLTDTEAEEVVRASEALSIAAESLSLGGAGGVGLGAGGGGGGAVGPGSVGGPGGRGGSVNFGPGYASQDEAQAALEMFLKIVGDNNRGAGGGGAGAVGPKARGGAGGDGADSLIDKMWLERGTHQVLIGRRGEDSILNLFDEEGVLQGQVIARSPGAVYAPYPATRGRPLGDADLGSNGFTVTTMILADSVTVRRGMVDILNALWRSYEYETSPFRAVWTLIGEFDTGSLPIGDLVELQILVRDPAGNCRLRESIDVEGPDPDAGFGTFQVMALNFTGSIPGVWTIEIASGATVLRSLGVRVSCPPVDVSDEGGGMLTIAYPIGPDERTPE